MSLVVRVIAPTGRDAELITAVLQQNGLAAEICSDPHPCLDRPPDEPIGPLLIAEEALNPALIRRIGEVIQNQPTWSDLPILLLTGMGRTESQWLPLGSPILLERPIRTRMLVSSVRAALRARQRQYENRDAFAERDLALAALKQERETLQVMLDNLPVGVVLAKASGELVLGNRSFEQILRHPLLPTPDIESHGEWIAFHPDGRRVKGEEYPLPRAMKTGQSIPPEDYLYQRGDGTLAWISLSAAPIFDDRGVVTGGVAAIADIDQQKRADAELRRSQDRFRRLIENASAGVMIGDFDGSISYANPAILKLLGYTAEDVAKGQLRWDQLTPPEFADADQKAFQQLRNQGTADPYRKEMLSRQGKRVPLLLGATVIPSQNETGSTDEIAVFLTDLSTQKQAESALIQSEKLAAVGRLAASISHEINNPLEAVTNLLYLARREENLPEEAQQFLATADQELSRVSQIVSQTLRFHRQSTRPRAITPQELLEPTLGLYHGRLMNSHIQLELEHRNPGSLVCSEGDIRQVLNNLIGNAIEAMRTGGRLVVRTRRSSFWKSAPGRSPAPGVRITIADTGHGIPPDVLKRIFEPFYTTKGLNGTGLGLWISLSIVEKHRGLLQVHTSVREGHTGTVFSLFLPTAAL